MNADPAAHLRDTGTSSRYIDKLEERYARVQLNRDERPLDERMTEMFAAAGRSWQTLVVLNKFSSADPNSYFSGFVQG